MSFTCKEDIQFEGKCAKNAGLHAYRMEPRAYHNAGWAIMFCPLFFRKPYLNRLSDQPAVSVKQLGTLSTYEHILAHELLHCNIIGIKEPGKSAIRLGRRPH